MKMENASRMTAALNIIGKTKMATANRRMEPKMIHTMIDNFFIKGQSAPFYTVSPLLFSLFLCKYVKRKAMKAYINAS